MIDAFNAKMLEFCKELACLFPKDGKIRSYGTVIKALNFQSKYRVCQAYMSAVKPHEDKLRVEDDTIFDDLSSNGSIFKTLGMKDLWASLEGRDEEKSTIWLNLQTLYVIAMECEPEPAPEEPKALVTQPSLDVQNDELFGKLLPPGVLEKIAENVEREFSDGKGGVDQEKLQKTLQASMSKLMPH